MSDSDSFIEEVSEEVRRDRLYGYIRRYGWIAVLVVVLIVGGAGWREYSKAQRSAEAQAFGDAILVALEMEDAPARMTALQEIEAPATEGQAVLDLLIAAEQVGAGNVEAAAGILQSVAAQNELPLIYRQIAQFKAFSAQDSGISIDDRRAGLQSLASPGAPLALLASEQLALLDISSGDTQAALDRLDSIANDAEATSGLRRRAQQLIIALGGMNDEG